MISRRAVRIYETNKEEALLKDRIGPQKVKMLWYVSISHI